jgi:chromosome segregation protein
MQQWQLEWDEFSAASEQPRQQAEVQQSRIRHLEETLEQAPGVCTGSRRSSRARDQPLEEERVLHEERVFGARGDEPAVAGARRDTVREQIEMARAKHRRTEPGSWMPPAVRCRSSAVGLRRCRRCSRPRWGRPTQS